MVLLVVDVKKGKEEISLIILVVGSSGKLVTSFSLSKGTMIEVRNILFSMKVIQKVIYESR